MFRGKHGDTEGNMVTANVKWCMMGAIKGSTLPQIVEACSGGVGAAMCTRLPRPFKMPDVAKVVVTAQVDGHHAVVGGENPWKILVWEHLYWEIPDFCSV